MVIGILCGRNNFKNGIFSVNKTETWTKYPFWVSGYIRQLKYTSLFQSEQRKLKQKQLEKQIEAEKRAKL